MGFGSNPTHPRQQKSRLRKSTDSVVGGDEILEMLSLMNDKLAEKAMRQSLRKAVKELIMPEAKRRVGNDTSELENSITVRAKKRSRVAFGYAVVVNSNKDSAAYAAKEEFGTKHRRANPFLRAAGYGNERRVFDLAVNDVKQMLNELKKAEPVD